MVKSPSNSDKNNYDPVFRHARREALIVLAVWIAGMLWTVCYCSATGYDIPPEQVHATLGIPNWVFWGVLVPWLCIIVFSIWFGLFFMAADDLGQTEGQPQSLKSDTGSKESRDV